jgi:zinc protease
MAARALKTRTKPAARKAAAHAPSVPCSANIAQFELPNGIRIFAYENFNSPAAVVSGYMMAGALDEPREKAGLAGFVADCLMRGTARYSYEQLFEQTESIGANLSVSGGMFTTGFYSKSLSEDLPLMMDLLGDVVRHPTFPDEEVEKERAEWLTGLQERANSTRAQCGLAFAELCYPEGHPYHFSTDGYPETAKAITLDEVRDFHREYYAPGDMVFVVTGAVKAENARDIIAGKFGDWEARRPERAPLPDTPKIEGRPRKHITMPGKSQSNLALGFPGPSQFDPDWTPCVMMNSILGQFGMYGRLGESVRKEEGLVYYIGSRFEGGVGPGSWNLYAGTNPSTVDRVIEIALKEVRRMRDRKVKPAELDDNQSYFVGVQPLQLETNEGIAGQILSMVRYKRGLDWMLSYEDRIRAITVADIQRAAQKWLDPDNFVLATAGA